MKTGYNILIVEDSRTEIAYLCAALSAYQFKLHIVEDGLAALQAIDKVCPDLVVLDVNLPVLDGYQVCSRLKRDPVSRHIPVIMLTSSDKAEAIFKGLQVGVDDFISKDNFAAENLLDTLKVYLP